MEVTNMRQEFA